MGGLALGSWIALRRRGGNAPGDLRRAELGLALAPMLAALALPALAAAGSAPAGWPADAAAFLLALLGGAAAGFECPLLALADPAASAPGEVGGRYYAAELVGSAAGALLVSLWLLPLLGLGWTLAFLAALKLASLAAVARALP